MGNENGKFNDIAKLPSKLDLLESAQNHYAFVQAVQFNQHLFHPNVVRYAIFRYENYWLPFAAKHLYTLVVAPMEIELVWVAHMIDAAAYERDCLKIANQLIPHPHKNLALEQRKNIKETEILWRKMYGDEMPLFVDNRRYPGRIINYNSTVSIDLAEVVDRYRSFCHQVSLPHYKDPKFLQAAIRGYFSERLNNEKNVLTTRDKEFVWRTHTLTPRAYQIDSDKLEKHRSKNSPTWFNICSENNPSHGSMPRGELIPLVQMIDEKKLLTSANKSITFRIVAYRIGNITAGKKYRLKLRSKSLIDQDERVLQALRVSDTGSCNTFPDDESVFKYDSSCADVLQIRVSEIKATRSSVNLSANGHGQFNFDYDLFNCGRFTDGSEVKLEFSMPVTTGRLKTVGAGSWVKLRCEDVHLGSIHLFLGMQVTSVHKSDHVSKVLSYHSMIAPYSTTLAAAPCLYTLKTLKDRYNETLYRCRIMKSLKGNFLSTEVLNLGGTLVCCSYTLGNEALPSESQVLYPETCCVLRESEEVVFAIRSSNYEWGLLKVFPMEADGNVIMPSKLLFMNLKGTKLNWECLYDVNKNTKIVEYNADGTHLLVDITFGKLSLPPSLYAFPELLSLGVTVLSLFHSFPYKGTLGHSCGRRQVGN